MSTELEKRIETLEAALNKAEEEKKAALGEKFKANAALKEAQEAREAAAEEAERKSGDLEAIEKRLTTKFQKQVDELTRERDTLAGDLRTIRVDNEVKSAIASGNVRAELVPAVEALLLRQAQYDDGVATIDGKSIADHAKSFFSSKDGAFYVNAPASSGSNSTGSVGAKPQRMTKETFNATEFMKIKVENPALANELAAEMGMPHLSSE